MTETKIVRLAEQKLSYQLRRRARMRYVRLSIALDGSLIVTAPKNYPQFLIQTLILNKEQWIKTNIAKRLARPSIFREHYSSEQIKQYKSVTKKLILKRLTHFNQFYKFKYKKITIRQASTRWGSCSKLGNLNFNYRLCLVDPKILDYVVVHELCHLQEFNHSKYFWALVAKKIPDYKNLRKQLKSLA